MNTPLLHKKLLRLAGTALLCFCCASAYAQNTDTRSFRVAYYDDSIYAGAGFIRTVEELIAASTDTIHVDKVEHEFSYIKQGGYLLHMPDRVSLSSRKRNQPPRFSPPRRR